MALSFARPKVNDKELIKKTKQKTTRTSIKGGNIASIIQSIVAMAEAKLKHHRDEYITIRDIDGLHNYIDKAIADGECGIDT